MAVTTKDIARICGLSRTTVNRALHDQGRIKDSTRQMILDTAKQLGYQPDLVARSLVKGISLSVGVVVVDLRNQYFPLMIDAMEREAKKSGYLLNITLSEGDPRTEKELIHTLIGHRVDGIIMAPVSRDEDFLSYLESLPVPFVLIGHEGTERIGAVGIDEYRASYDATGYIGDRGYGRAAFVAPSLDNEELTHISGHRRRLEGFRAAAEERGMAYEIILDEDYCAAVARFIQGGEGRAALLCSGEVFAHNILMRLGKSELIPPRDYGLMGFDNFEIFQSWSPAITTVDNPIGEIGRLSFRMIKDLIDGKGIENRFLPYRIIEGETL